MRLLFLAAFMPLWMCYILSAQNIMPNPIDFSTLGIDTIMAGRVIISDTSYKPNGLYNFWTNGVGAPTKMNEYYRMNGALSTLANHELVSPSICFSDTNFLHIFHVYYNRYQGTLATPRSVNVAAFCKAIHYDVCAPNRTKTVAGTTTSYQETYPDWSDSSGNAFGYLTRNGGFDSVFADGNKRRVYTPSDSAVGTLILTHPYPNDEMTGHVSDAIDDNTQNYLEGKELYLSFNLRRLDSASGNPNDTVLIIRMPYTVKPGMGPLTNPTHYTVFNKVPHDTAQPVQILATALPAQRGLSKPLMNRITDSIIITRAMLPDADIDITYSALCNLKGDTDLSDYIDSNENHRLWAEGIAPDDTSTSVDGRIKRLEPEIIYKGNCSLAIDWVRIETPAAQTLLRGQIDHTLKGMAQRTLNLIAEGKTGEYPTPNPWAGAYQGNIRWHRIWLLEEDHPRTYHAIGYLNHVFGGRGASETGYTTFWPTREFDENGNAVEIAPGSIDPDSANYRAVQMRYYTEHYARETNMKECERGDTYAVVANNAAPYIWKSGKDSSTTLGLFSGYFNMNIHKEQYNLGGLTYAMMQNNIHYRYQPRWPASSLANIEGTINKFATDPFMLFDTKRDWYSSLWAAAKYNLMDYTDSMLRNCTPGVDCPRRVEAFSLRQSTGEELRFGQWLSRILGMKGQGTWMYHSKPIGAYYNDVMGLPWTSSVAVDNDLTGGYIGPHTYTAVRTTPPDTATNLSWYKNESLGTDYFETNDPTNLHLFAPSRSIIASNWGVDEDKIFLGRKTMRHELKRYHDFCYYYDTVLVRLDLDFWYAKGFRTFNTARNTAKDVFFHRKIDSSAFTVKHIGYDTAKGIYTYSEPEPFDSTFFDITMLRDKTKSDTNEFYIGVINRRLDPVFTIKMSDSLSFGTTYADTTISTTKRFCFVPSVEFDSLITLTSHPLVANKTIHKFCQYGARQISVPFKVRGMDDGDYPLLRIEELGGTLDTVIGSNRPLALNYLPGEGKIFRVRVQYPERFTGELPHSNQTKLVSHNIMMYDTAKVYIQYS